MSASISTPLSSSMTALSQILVGDETVGRMLHRVADLANTTIAGSDMVSIAMLVKGRPRTVAFTNVAATQIDDAQYHSRSGPCVDALRNQQVLRVDSTTDAKRWPRFSDAAGAHAILSSISLPLVARHATIGAVNCYSHREAAFSAGDERIGSMFASAAAVAVANAQAFWGERHLSEQMGSAMESRATIEQAKGILIAEQHCDADEAFAMLARTSQGQNRKLSEIADELVARRRQPGEPAKVHASAWLADPINTDKRTGGRPRRVGHVDRRRHVDHRPDLAQMAD